MPEKPKIKSVHTSLKAKPTGKPAPAKEEPKKAAAKTAEKPAEKKAEKPAEKKAEAPAEKKAEKPAEKKAEAPKVKSIGIGPRVMRTSVSTKPTGSKGK